MASGSQKLCVRRVFRTGQPDDHHVDWRCLPHAQGSGDLAEAALKSCRLTRVEYRGPVISSVLCPLGSFDHVFGGKMDEAREIIDRGVRLWNDRDPAYMDLFTHDAELSIPSFKGSGAEAVRTFYSVWQNAFPDNQVRPVGIYQDGDVGILQGVFEGTHTGALNIPEQSSIEATNQKVSVPFAQIYTVRNGKVKSLTGYFDPAGLMSQLGIGDQGR